MRTAYNVRFKGHLCAGVQTGFSRKPILVRKRKNEMPFTVIVNIVEGEPDEALLEYYDKAARLECARAIKRTQKAYRSLNGDHLLRGVPSVERLQKLLAPGKVTRRGKRWKICPL